MIEFPLGGRSSGPVGCLTDLGHTHSLGTTSHPCSQGTAGPVLFEHQSVDTSICQELLDTSG